MKIKFLELGKPCSPLSTTKLKNQGITQITLEEGLKEIKNQYQKDGRL